MDGQPAPDGLEPREGGGVPQDEVLRAKGWLEYEFPQEERTEVRKVQPSEVQSVRGADKSVAVQGELRS